MRTKTRLGILLVVWLLASAAGSAGANSSATGLSVGSTAPQFTLKDLDGGSVSLSSLLKANRAVVISFWGLRCQACIQEMPSLDALHGKYGTAGLAVLGINVDGVGAGVIKAQLPNITAMPGYLLLPDEELKVADLYRMAAAPLTILVDSSGTVVYVHEGYSPGDEKELESRVAKLLR